LREGRGEGREGRFSCKGGCPQAGSRGEASPPSLVQRGKRKGKGYLSTERRPLRRKERGHVLRELPLLGTRRKTLSHKGYFSLKKKKAVSPPEGGKEKGPLVQR